MKLYELYRLLFLTAITSFLLFSCRNNSSNPANTPLLYQDSGSKALVIVVENKNLLDMVNEQTYELFKADILPIFSDMFTVPQDSMQNLTLAEIIDKYGEQWQLNQIADSAKGYDRIVKLNKQTATVQCLLDSLKMLGSEGYTIDMVFNLHGSMTTILFNDKEIDIGTLTQSIKDNGIRIRALYQTTCYAKYMLPFWNNIGVFAVNGAADNNQIVLFSSAYFVSQWISGKTFEDAVYSAYNMEIATLRSYNDRIPIDTYILTPQVLANSRQYVSGRDQKILWKNIPAIPPKI